MRKRDGYVSNSSSSSFLIPFDIGELRLAGVSCIKLPNDIWKAIERNHVEYNGKKFDMSMSENWWLTDMVSDCVDAYSAICETPNAIPYLDGDSVPYGYYDENGEQNFIKFRKYDTDYFILASDFIENDGKDDIPSYVHLRDEAKKVFNNKSLNLTQKMNLIKHLFDF